MNKIPKNIQPEHYFLESIQVWKSKSWKSLFQNCIYTEKYLIKNIQL